MAYVADNPVSLQAFAAADECYSPGHFDQACGAHEAETFNRYSVRLRSTVRAHRNPIRTAPRLGCFAVAHVGTHEPELVIFVYSLRHRSLPLPLPPGRLLPPERA
jgi:hypothetical protein